MAANDKGIEVGGEKPAAEVVKPGGESGRGAEEGRDRGQQQQGRDARRTGVRAGDQAGGNQAGRQHQGELRSPQEMPNGTGKVIGDDDKVVIREHLSFTAIEPDDNKLMRGGGVKAEVGKAIEELKRAFPSSSSR